MQETWLYGDEKDDCAIAELLNSLPSDHKAVTCLLNLQPPPAVKKTLTYRKLRDINFAELSVDIEQSSLCHDPSKNLSDLAVQFDAVLLELLDSHAPLVTKTVTVRSTAPWFSDELRQAKQEKRKAERKYLKSHLEVDKQIYKEHCKSYKMLLDNAKKDYHKSSILESGTRDLFRTVNSLSNPNSERSLPSHDSEEELAERFADYFEQKINTIRSDIDSCDPPSLSVTSVEKCSSSFTQFEELGEGDVRKIILDSPTKSCLLDAFPTWLLKRCIDSLLLIITSMVNMSLSTGTIPSKDSSGVPHSQETSA